MVELIEVDLDDNIVDKHATAHQAIRGAVALDRCAAAAQRSDRPGPEGRGKSCRADSEADGGVLKSFDVNLREQSRKGEQALPPSSSSSSSLKDSNCLGHSNTVSNAKIHPAFMQPQSAEEEMAIQKEWGNEAFREGEFAQAADHYSNALAALDKMQGEQGGSNGHGRATTIAMKQRVSLLSNRAQVRFKAGQARAAVADCIAAIEHDQASLKALYWGAAAARSLEEWPMATKWIGQARKHSPHNSEIALLYRQIHSESVVQQMARVVEERLESDRSKFGKPGRTSNGRRCSPSPLLTIEAVVHDLTQDGHNGDDADDISIEDMLDHIRTILVESAHARCLFTTKLRGLDVCMLYLSRAYHQKAAAALKAASLPLAAPQEETDHDENGVGDKEDENTSRHSPLCEWPEHLLPRIAERALDSLCPVDTTTSPATEESLSTTCFDLLQHASSDSVLRCGVLAARTMSSQSDRTRTLCRLSIVERVLQAVSSHAKEIASSGDCTGAFPLPVAQSIAQMLGNYTRDTLSRRALAALGATPISALLHLYKSAQLLGKAQVDRLVSTLHTPEQVGSPSIQSALKQIQTDIIALARTCVDIATSLCKDKTLLFQEAFSQNPQTKTRTKTKTKTKTTPTDLLPTIMQLCQDAEDQAPEKLTAVLGINGSARDYDKRKYAADLVVSNVGRSGSRSEPAEGLPVICRLIRLLAAALGSHATARVLSRRDATTLLLGRLSAWQCSSLSAVLRDAYFSLFVHDRSARHEALHTKLHLPMLEAALTHGVDTDEWELVRDVVEAFEGYFTHSSTAAFAAFCAMDSGSSSGLIRLWRLVKRMHSPQDGPSGTSSQTGGGSDGDDRAVKKAVRHSVEQILLNCIERGRRQTFTSTSTSASRRAPQGPSWEFLGVEEVLDLEARITKRAWKGLEHANRETDDNDGHHQQQQLQSQPTIGSGKWEFHLTEPKYTPKAQESLERHQLDREQSMTTSSQQHSSSRTLSPDEYARIHLREKTSNWSSKLERVGNDSTANHDKMNAGELTRGQLDDNREEFDEDGLRSVRGFDSCPPTHIFRARNEWKSLDLAQKLRWTQTSTDVLIWIRVPLGTRAKDLQVTVLPTRLTVKLLWYGRICDGPLSRRCKAGESCWVLEDEEVHIMIPKDDSLYWRSVFEGGQEKSYYEVLKELVAADEPVKGYDEMGERSRELVDNIREHQELVQEGLVDPRGGFDEFRLVLGEGTEYA